MDFDGLRESLERLVSYLDLRPLKIMRVSPVGLIVQTGVDIVALKVWN